jgi:hypothetical protein
MNIHASATIATHNLQARPASRLLSELLLNRQRQRGLCGTGQPLFSD